MLIRTPNGSIKMNVLLYVIVALASACSSSTKDSFDIDHHDNQLAATREMRRFASVFCGLRHDSEVPASITDSNAVVFIKEARFQRSYIFNAHRHEQRIMATFHEIDLDYLDSKADHQVFTKGIVFEMSVKQWERLLASTADMMPKFATDSYQPGLLDAGIFIMAYNGKTFIINEKYLEDCEAFSNQILNELVDPEFLRVRKDGELQP